MTFGTLPPTDLSADWRDRAACAGYANGAFFPTIDANSGPTVDKALAICGACEVTEECLSYALESNQVSGIWGGTTEKQRRSLRRKWLAERRRAS